MSDSTSILVAELADTRKALREAREALRAAYPVGSWCPKCGSDIDKPETWKPCPDKERGCERARAALSRPEGT